MHKKCEIVENISLLYVESVGLKKVVFKLYFFLII